MGRFLVFALVLGLVQLSLANQQRQRNLGRGLGKNVGRMETVDSYASPSQELLRDLPVEQPKFSKTPVVDSYGSQEETFVDDGYGSSLPVPAPKMPVPQRELPLPVPEPILPVRPIPSRKSFNGYSQIQRDTTTTTTTTTTPVFSGYGSVPARKTISKDLPALKKSSSYSSRQRDEIPVTTPAPIRDLCRPNPCRNLGRCVSDSTSLRGFRCLCSQYFFGDFCEREIRTTTTTVAPLPNYGGDSYSSDMGGESDNFSFDEESLIETNKCLNEGKLGSNGLCICPWGWSGQFCEICLTSCASNPCGGLKKCIAKYGGGFECVCPENRKGLNCELQNDACSAKTCLNGGICKPILGGSARCECLTPFAGESCEKQWNNPCTEEVLRSLDVMNFEFPWDSEKYIVCTDVDEWVAMNCSFGTKFNVKLGHCIPDLFELPELPADYCEHGSVFLTEKAELACLCRAGYTGEFCEIDIDECSTQRSRYPCVDQVGTFYLQCSDYEIGLDCTDSIEIPCTEENLAKGLHYFQIGLDGFHYVHCSGVDTFTVQKCAGGLFWNQEEETCTFDKPEIKTGVCTTFPCKNGARCMDRGGSNFECVCREGYTGRLCEKLVDLCELKNPCMNGGKCLSYPGGYTCVCPDKLIDDCCCNGVSNPCPMKPIPGVSSYFPHLFPHKYIHCDYEGRAFVRTCAPGTRWRQAVLSCLPEDFVMNSTEIIEPLPVPKPDRDMIIPGGKKSSGYSSFVEPEVTTRLPLRPTTPARDLIMPERRRPSSSGYGQVEIPTTTPFVPFVRPTTPQRDIIRKPEVSYGSKKISIAKEEKLPIVLPVKPIVTPAPQPTYGSELPTEDSFNSEQFLDEDQFGEESEEEEEIEEQPVAYGSSLPSKPVGRMFEKAPVRGNARFAAPAVPEPLPVEQVQTRGRLVNGQRGGNGRFVAPAEEELPVEQVQTRGRLVGQRGSGRLAAPAVPEPLPVEQVQTRGRLVGQRGSGRLAAPAVVEEPVTTFQSRPVGRMSGQRNLNGNF